MLGSIIKNVEYLGLEGRKCMNLSMIMFLSSALKNALCLKKSQSKEEYKSKQRVFPPTQEREGKVM